MDLHLLLEDKLISASFLDRPFSSVFYRRRLSRTLVRRVCLSSCAWDAGTRTFLAQDGPHPVIVEADPCFLLQMGIKSAHRPDTEAVPQRCRLGLDRLPQRRSIFGRRL